MTHTHIPHTDCHCPACAPGEPRCRTILVVEDDPTLRECLRQLFEGAGYRVLEAAYLLGVEAMALTNSDIGSVVVDGRVPWADGQQSISSVPLAVTLHQVGVRVTFHSGDMDLCNEARAKGLRVVPKGSGVAELLKAVEGA